MTSETGGSGGSEEESAGEATPPVQTSAGAAQAPEVEVPTQAGPQQVGEKRTRLRIIKENIQSLSKDVGSFRKSQEASTKRLEKQVISLRNELAALKSNITREAAKSRKKQDATLSRILAKVSGSQSLPDASVQSLRDAQRNDSISGQDRSALAALGRPSPPNLIGIDNKKKGLTLGPRSGATPCITSRDRDRRVSVSLTSL